MKIWIRLTWSVGVAVCLISACGRVDTGSQDGAAAVTAVAVTTASASTDTVRPTMGSGYPVLPTPVFMPPGTVPTTTPEYPGVFPLDTTPSGIDYQTPSPFDPSKVSPIAIVEDPPHALGVITNGTFMVVSVESGSTAEKIGLQVGDVISTIDSITTRSRERSART